MQTSTTITNQFNYFIGVVTANADGTFAAAIMRNCARTMTQSIQQIAVCDTYATAEMVVRGELAPASFGITAQSAPAAVVEPAPVAQVEAPAEMINAVLAKIEELKNNTQVIAKLATIANADHADFLIKTAIAVLSTGVEICELPAPVAARTIVGKPDGTAVVTTADGAVEVLPARTEAAPVVQDAQPETAARERRNEAIAFAELRLTEKYEAEKAAALAVCKFSNDPCKMAHLDAALRNIEIGYQVEYKRASGDAWAQYEEEVSAAQAAQRNARIASADAAHKERIEAADWVAQGSEQAKMQEPKKIQLILTAASAKKPNTPYNEKPTTKRHNANRR